MKKTLLEKRYYTIKEIANYLEVNSSAIRFWEKQFSFVQPNRSSKGMRRFSVEEVKKLEMIHHLLKVKGYTIEGAKQKLKEKHHDSLSNLEIIQKLEHVKEVLTQLKKQLK